MGEIESIEAWAGAKLPEAYKSVLGGCEAGVFHDPVLIYPAADVVERNRTFETTEYCPGHIAIGDDGGGRAVVIGLGDHQTCPVFVVDHGSMSPASFEMVAADLAAWVGAGCPLPAGEA